MVYPAAELLSFVSRVEACVPVTLGRPPSPALRGVVISLRVNFRLRLPLSAVEITLLGMFWGDRGDKTYYFIG